MIGDDGVNGRLADPVGLALLVLALADLLEDGGNAHRQSQHGSRRPPGQHRGLPAGQNVKSLILYRAVCWLSPMSLAWSYQENIMSRKRANAFHSPLGESLDATGTYTMPTINMPAAPATRMDLAMRRYRRTSAPLLFPVAGSLSANSPTRNPHGRSCI